MVVARGEANEVYASTNSIPLRLSFEVGIVIVEIDIIDVERSEYANVVATTTIAVTAVFFLFIVIAFIHLIGRQKDTRT